MGASKQEFEKMRYSVFTEPLTEKEFSERYKYDISINNNWHREPDDYEKLFKDDPKHKELRKVYKDAKKDLDQYKELKRQLNK